MKKEMPSLKKVLIIDIFGIGDVLFTTPLISNIKSSFPDSFIGYVCNKRTAPLLAYNPKVDKIFIYEKDDYRHLCRESKIAFIKKIFDSLREIKKERFEVVMDISLNKYSSFLMWLVGIPRRVGLNYKNRSPFLTDKIKLEGYENKHVADYYIDLLQALGVVTQNKKFELLIQNDERVWAKEWLKKNGIKPSDRVIAVVPGGGASWGKNALYKRWPAEKFAQLADKMVEKFSVKIILLSDIYEQDLAVKVKQAMHREAVCLMEEVPLRQFAALLAECHLAVLNDGGPLHMAVAVGTKTVSIFGPVDDVVYGPYLREGHAVVTKDIACRPCYRQFKVADCEHHNCLNLISVSNVLEKVKENL